MRRSTGSEDAAEDAGPAVVDALHPRREEPRAGDQRAEEEDELDRGPHQNRSGLTIATTK